MKILVIGSGGREHALVWKLAQSPSVQIMAAPGNPGIATTANTVKTTDYLGLAERFQPDLTVVGPEAPLVNGIVDQFRQRGFPIVGPTAAAAQLESSKAYAKSLMDSAGIPNARYTTVANLVEARQALKTFDLPVVLKADGLAAGKGVIIAQNADEAALALPSLFNLSPRIVIEEFLRGEELSFIALTDGTHIVPLEPTQDHKTIFEGDRGPNTGGMGAYCDSRIVTDSVRQTILDTVIEPAVATMRKQQVPFTGFLYAGIMLTETGPKVLEFNARLGDPETQALMHRMESDFVPALEAAAHGRLAGSTLSWKPDPSVCVVLAAHGYPGDVRIGDPITGLDHLEQATGFHAGTQMRDNVLKTAGGRVLGITASGPTLESAIATVYEETSKIHFHGMQFRRDIGAKGLKRW